MKTVFKSRVFSVETGTRTFPDGLAREVTVVRHAPSVVLIPMEDDGRVVLIRQYRASLDREIWEFPAGRMDPHETPEATAARECEEEIGRVPERIERLGAFYPTPGYCDELLIFFKVGALRAPAPDSPHHADEDEQIECRSVTVEEARAMLARGEIIDLKTAYSLTLL